MKSTSLTTIHVLGIGSFLFLVSSGITAHAIMAGMLILVVWAAAAMVAIELRSPVLETELIGRRSPLSSDGITSQARARNIVPMPVEARTAA